MVYYLTGGMAARHCQGRSIPCPFCFVHYILYVASYFLPPDYTAFCNRLIFPIRNEKGELVAFAGRYRGETEGTDIRKYVNSPTSPVYHKSEILYGLYQAQDEIRKHKFVYITE